MFKKIRSVVVGLAITALLSCDFKEAEDPFEVRTGADGTTTVESTKEFTPAKLVGEGKFSEAREKLCKIEKEIDCKKALLEKGIQNEEDFAKNVMVAIIDTGKFIEAIDSALGTMRTLFVVSPPSLEPKQENVVDTILSMMGLDREMLTTYAIEINMAFENIEKWEKGKQTKFVLKKMPVKIEDVINVTFENVIIDWDEINGLGAASKGVLAAFKVLNTHNLELPISDILNRLSDLLEELRDNPIGLIRHAASTLNFDKYPNFLGFGEVSYCKSLYEKGCPKVWKDIPIDISLVLKRAKEALNYFFAEDNWCGKEKDLVCFYDGATTGRIGGYTEEQPEDVSDDKWCKDKKADCIKFNIERGVVGREGRKTEGYVALPGDFTDEGKDALLKFIGDVAGKMECGKAGEHKISLADIDELLREHIKVIEFKIPNFADFDFCKYFGWGGRPKPLRDLTVDEFQCYEEGRKTYCFAFEAEVPEGMKVTIPLDVGDKFEGYYKVNEQQFNVSVTSIDVYGKSIAISEGDFLKIYVLEDGTVGVTAPSDIKIQDYESDSTKVVGPISLKYPYIFAGDAEHFRGIVEGGIGEDYVSPLTDVSEELSYPDDIITIGRQILDQIANTFLIYSVLKDPTLNGSLRVNICPLLSVTEEKAKELKDKKIIKESVHEKISNVVRTLTERECGEGGGQLKEPTHESGERVFVMIQVWASLLLAERGGEVELDIPGM